MIKEEQLDNMLYEKMQKEYDSFLEKIKSEQSLKPNQAIESAYEIVYKQDILYCFEDNDLNLSYKEKKHLLSKKRPLEFLYQEWLTTDWTCSHIFKTMNLMSLFTFQVIPIALKNTTV